MEWDRIKRLLNEENDSRSADQQVKDSLFLRDKVLTVKEFANFRNQIGGDNKVFDACLKALKYEFHPRNSILLYSGQKRSRFQFLLEGNCAVFQLKQEASLNEEITLSTALLKQQAAIKVQQQNLANQEKEKTAEELNSVHVLLKNMEKIQQDLESQLSVFRKESEQTRLKEAINELDDRKLKNRLLSKHFSQGGQLCLFSREKGLIGGDTVEEINLSGKEVKSTIIAVEDCHVLSISVSDYSRIFSHIVNQIYLSQRILRSYFPGIGEETVQQLAYDFRAEFFDRNEAIYNQGGANMDAFFILFSGSVEIRKYYGKSHITEQVKKQQSQQQLEQKNHVSQTEGSQKSYSLLDNYHSIMIFSGRQVFGAECLARYNEYSAVSVSTETQVLIVDRKKFDGFEHAFNFRGFFKMQGQVQLKFYQDRLMQLAEFSNKRQQEQEMSKKIFELSAASKGKIQGQNIGILKAAPSAIAMTQLNLRNSETRQSFNALINRQQGISSDINRMTTTTSSTATDQNFTISTRFPEPISEKNIFSNTNLPRENELIPPQQVPSSQVIMNSQGFHFEEDDEKARRTNILIEHRVQKQLNTRPSKSPTKNYEKLMLHQNSQILKSTKRKSDLRLLCLENEFPQLLSPQDSSNKGSNQLFMKQFNFSSRNSVQNINDSRSPRAKASNNDINIPKELIRSSIGRQSLQICRPREEKLRLKRSFEQSPFGRIITSPTSSGTMNQTVSMFFSSAENTKLQEKQQQLPEKVQSNIVNQGINSAVNTNKHAINDSQDNFTEELEQNQGFQQESLQIKKYGFFQVDKNKKQSKDVILSYANHNKKTDSSFQSRDPYLFDYVGQNNNSNYHQQNISFRELETLNFISSSRNIQNEQALARSPSIISSAYINTTAPSLLFKESSKQYIPPSPSSQNFSNSLTIHPKNLPIIRNPSRKNSSEEIAINGNDITKPRSHRQINIIGNLSPLDSSVPSIPLQNQPKINSGRRLSYRNLGTVMPFAAEPNSSISPQKKQIHTNKLKIGNMSMIQSRNAEKNEENDTVNILDNQTTPKIRSTELIPPPPIHQQASLQIKKRNLISDNFIIQSPSLNELLQNRNNNRDNIINNNNIVSDVSQKEISKQKDNNNNSNSNVSLPSKIIKRQIMNDTGIAVSARNCNYRQFIKAGNGSCERLNKNNNNSTGNSFFMTHRQNSLKSNADSPMSISNFKQNPFAKVKQSPFIKFKEFSQY